MIYSNCNHPGEPVGPYHVKRKLDQSPAPPLVRDGRRGRLGPDSRVTTVRIPPRTFTSRVSRSHFGLTMASKSRKTSLISSS